MQIQITDHEAVATDANFKPTDHPDILIDSAGRVAILNDDDTTHLISIDR